METKRCAHCHKLHRAGTRVCSHCGKPLVVVAPEQESRPTILPASPHLAGHYSGLHPEDQPYQSMKIAVQSVTEHGWHATPEPVVLPTTDEDEHAPEIERQVTFPARHKNWTEPISRWKTAVHLRMPKRVIPLLLGLSGIFFLLASSILAFTFMDKNTSLAGAAVLASPATGLRPQDSFTLSGHGFGAHSLVSLTYDQNQPILNEQGQPLRLYTDNGGDFTVRITIPTGWAPGSHTLHVTDEAQKLSVSTHISVQPPTNTTPKLELSTKLCTFPIDTAGVISNQAITLINSGGGQIDWKASSEQTWLTASPDSGTFSGRQDVQVRVNRTALGGGSYNGLLTFSAGNMTATLNVKMDVRAVGAPISVSSTALTFTAQNSATQLLTLNNESRLALDWTGTPGTDDGTDWLSITPAQGHLEAGTGVNIAVRVSVQQLTVGKYHGTLTFASGETKLLVSIALTVTPPPAPILSVPTRPLTFGAFANNKPAAQKLIVSNTGNAPLSWTATIDTPIVSITPAQGNLAAGEKVTLTVDATETSVGTQTATITLADKDHGQQQQKIPVTVTIKDQADITISQNNFSFNNDSDFQETSQLLMIGNDGSRDLNWTLVPDDNANWLHITNLSGSLVPGASTAVSITCDSGTLQPGSYKAQVTIKDNNRTASSQTITITLNVT